MIGNIIIIMSNVVLTIIVINIMTIVITLISVKINVKNFFFFLVVCPAWLQGPVPWSIVFIRADS